MDDVILNKISVIENCLKRIHEEYSGHETELEYNFTKQDSIILNMQRLCEASLDLGTRLIRLKNYGIPQNSKDIFVILEKENVITAELSDNLQKMVGFRNIAVHDYQKVNLDIVRSIINSNLSNFTDFIKSILAQTIA